jgi:uncharacterized protein YbaR (Trm112 family)
MNAIEPAAVCPCDPELLKVLCCPETRQAVAPAPAAVLEKLNLQVDAGSLHRRDGGQVSSHIEAGLIRADGKVLYPVRNGIPIMLAGEGIPLMP